MLHRSEEREKGQKLQKSSREPALEEMGKGSRKDQGTYQNPWKGLEAEEYQDARESDETKGVF